MGVAANVGEYVYRQLFNESCGKPVERVRFLDTLKVLQVLIESGTNGVDGLLTTNWGNVVVGADTSRSPVKKSARLKGKSSSAVSSAGSAASASTTASSEPERNASARAVDQAPAVAAAMYRSSGLRVYNPSFDSSNFLAALEGGEPNRNEIFIQEQGNSFFSVGGQQATVGQEVHVPSPPQAPRPSSSARRRTASSGGNGSRPSSASPGTRGGGSRPQGSPAAANCPSSPAAGQQAVTAGLQSPVLLAAAGKPSHELAVCVSAVTGHRNAHTLAAPQDGPRGRGARNAAITCRDHCGRIAQDLCSASAGTVAGSLIHPQGR